MVLDNHLLRTFSLLFSSFSARKKKQRGRKSPERTLPCPSLLKRLLNMIGAYDQLSLSLPSNVYLPVVRAVVRKMYVCARDDNVRRYSREQIECFLLGTRLPFRFSLPITRARFSLRTRVQHNTKTKSSNDANEEQRSRCTSARGFLYLPLWGCTFHLSVNPPLPPAPCLVLSLGLVPLSLSLQLFPPPLSPPFHFHLALLKHVARSNARAPLCRCHGVSPSAVQPTPVLSLGPTCMCVCVSLRPPRRLLTKRVYRLAVA